MTGPLDLVDLTVFGIVIFLAGLLLGGLATLAYYRDEQEPSRLYSECRCCGRHYWAEDSTSTTGLCYACDRSACWPGPDKEHHAT